MNSRKTLYISLFSFFFLFFSCSEELLDGHIIDEVEPNEYVFQANEITEGNVYRGFIDHPVDGEADQDLFKIWTSSGTVVVFEFESEDEDFEPYVGHGSGGGHGEFAIFNMPGRYTAEFASSVTGWKYFEIGDKRNVLGGSEKFGGFTYYFRVKSYHVCYDRPYATLTLDSLFDGNFYDDFGNIKVVNVEIEEHGYHQLNLNSEEQGRSDKFMFVYDCDARQVIIGNDDEDFYSGKYDPLIYGGFQRSSNYVLIIGRNLADLTRSYSDRFEVSLKKQLPDRELEPNNLYHYANVTGRNGVSGKLDQELVKINGVKGHDVDIFKYRIQRGELVNFEIETGNEKGFHAQFWVGSYAETGSMIIPLRFSQLSGSETHHINMYAPFSGWGYLHLQGRGVPYEFNVTSKDSIEKMETFENEVYEVFETPDCKWAFREWTMPEKGDLFEINIKGENSPGGVHIFSSDRYPYSFVEPMEDNRFFIHRYEKTENIVFGFYFSNCDQRRENIMEVSIVEEIVNYTEWLNGFESTPVNVYENGAYQGFFDTDNYFIENIFELEAWQDGTLFLTTAPDIYALSDFHIDTVITLEKEGDVIDKNDNMVEFLNYNKYSFLTHQVEAGEIYRIKVSPFMTGSSHVPSMNIIGHYILDIRIK